MDFLFGNPLMTEPSKAISDYFWGKPTTIGSKVRLPDFLGIWYEMESLPIYFTSGYTKCTITYALNPSNDKELLITNGYTNQQGNPSTSEMTAEILADGAQMLMSTGMFLVPKFKMSIMAVEAGDAGSRYEYAMLGTTQRKDGLWLLSRTPVPMPLAVRARFIAKATDFDVTKLTIIKQTN